MVHHADDAVIAEFVLTGTHEGPLRGIPPSGEAFECRCAAFLILEGERLVCERVFSDTATILVRLGLSPGLPAG